MRSHAPAGVNPARAIGDVVIASKWILPQQQRFIRPLNDTRYFYYKTPNTFTDDTFEKMPNGEYISFNRPDATQCSKGLTPAQLAAYKAKGEVATPGFALPVVNQILSSKDGMDAFKGTVPGVVSAAAHHLCCWGRAAGGRGRCCAPPLARPPPHAPAPPPPSRVRSTPLLPTPASWLPPKRWPAPLCCRRATRSPAPPPRSRWPCSPRLWCARAGCAAPAPARAAPF